MEIFVLWIALSVVAGVVAHNKGRSGVGLFFLSLVLSPLVGLIVAFAISSRQRMEMEAAQRGDSAEFRKCPFCAEVVRREALKCKHCGSELTPAAPAPNPSPADRVADAAARKTALGITAVIVVVALVIVAVVANV